VHEFEKEQVLEELRQHSFHMTNAAKALGLERSHLYKKAELLGIDLRAVRRGGKSRDLPAQSPPAFGKRGRALVAGRGRPLRGLLLAPLGTKNSLADR